MGILVDAVVSLYLPSKSQSVHIRHKIYSHIAYTMCILCIYSAMPEERDVISVNYVSPLVLRKELENLMDNEGVGALESPDIIREKQVIFWNMVSIIEIH